MLFESKKVENCFSDSQTYEYSLPLTNRQLIPRLEASYTVRINEKFRRPVFHAENTAGVRIKGILKERILSVSYPTENWEREKEGFEQWIRSEGEE